MSSDDELKQIEKDIRESFEGLRTGQQVFHRDYALSAVGVFKNEDGTPVIFTVVIPRERDTTVKNDTVLSFTGRYIDISNEFLVRVEDVD